ncbi:putative aldehyde dehydrogenase domain, aldehyde/histidinol dehydrogenase [Plasmopara halstedii]
MVVQFDSRTLFMLHQGRPVVGFSRRSSKYCYGWRLYCRAHLTQHSDVDKVALTGSTETGLKSYVHRTWIISSASVCIAGSRVYVQEGIYDEFVRRSGEAASSMKMVIHKICLSNMAHDRRCSRVYIEPTVFADVTEEMTIVVKRFWSVMSIIKFKTIDEVIERATIPTNTPFGGFKNSGVGREQGMQGLRNYLKARLSLSKRRDDSVIIQSRYDIY